jgi:pimeloyl-ACP methyl ester carboxylesterase
MGRRRRAAGAAGVAIGAAAMGAAALMTAQKIAAARLRLQPDPAQGDDLGQLHGRPLTVLADDGVPLHAEINGPDDAPVTIVFSHGYTLNQGCWHYQRAGLSGRWRLVFWDQRSHGRSGRSDPAHVSIGQLGADLRAVLMAAAPGASPAVLVGHSMGGMAIMALARQHPELFGSKIIGVMLIGTAGVSVDPTSWLPPVIRPVARQITPVLLRGAARKPLASVVERARQASGNLAFLSTRLIGFGDGRVSPAAVDYLERIIRSTPIDVVARFYLTLLDHDEMAALGVLGRVPTVVLTGDSDRMVPPRLSDDLAAAIPGAQLIRVPGAGHVVILERPEAVNEAITALVAAALAGQRARGQTA